jgi:hypothetical protein
MNKEEEEPYFVCGDCSSKITRYRILNELTEF